MPTSAASTPVVIEVAVNGVTTPARNPHAPGSPEQVAAQAIDCIDAGATIIHTHTTTRLSTDEATEHYATMFALVRAERPEAIVYPTMQGGTTIDERYGHHATLAERGLIDMGVIDPGSVNLSGSKPDGSPPSGEFVYVNSPADIAAMMHTCREHGLGPSFAIYEPGFLRMVLIYHDAGRLAPGSLTKFYFSGSGYFGGGTPAFSAPPIPEALELYLAMLGDRPLPWGVAVLGGSLLDTPIAQMALARGGHLRVGLEDDGAGPSNVEQTRRAAALCTEAGRTVATPAETRTLLGLV